LKGKIQLKAAWHAFPGSGWVTQGNVIDKETEPVPTNSETGIRLDSPKKDETQNILQARTPIRWSKPGQVG